MKIYSPHILGSFGQSGSSAYFDGNVGIGTTSPSAKLDVSGSVIITGSLNVSAGITGSLLGTASYATNALSASYALNSTNTVTATNANNIAVTNTTSGTGPYYLMFVDGTTGNRTARVDSNTLTFNATTDLLTATASYANQAASASYALNSTTAATASYVITAQTASYVLNSVSSSYALSASYARTASYVQNAITASYVLNAVSSSYALTASYALNGGSGNPFPYSGSAEITGSLVVNDGLANLIDTVGYTLGDTNSVVSVGWGDRRLVHSGGGVAIYWDTPNQQQSVEVSRAYLKSTPDINAQENFSAGVFNAEGRIIEGVSFNGASDYNFVYLDNAAGEWMPVDNLSSRATKMLGIAFNVGSNNSVLLEGHVTITNTPGTYNTPAVDVIAHGLPIYVSSSAFATTTAPTTTGEYVRILGHAYYQNTGDPDVWVMNFRPDHTWVEL